MPKTPATARVASRAQVNENRLVEKLNSVELLPMEIPQSVMTNDQLIARLMPRLGPIGIQNVMMNYIFEMPVESDPFGRLDKILELCGSKPIFDPESEFYIGGIISDMVTENSDPAFFRIMIKHGFNPNVKVDEGTESLLLFALKMNRYSLALNLAKLPEVEVNPEVIGEIDRAMKELKEIHDVLTQRL